MRDMIRSASRPSRRNCSGDSTSITSERTCATWPGAAASSTSEAGFGEDRVGESSICGIRLPPNQTPVLEAGDDPRQAGQRCVGDLRQRAHPHRALRGFRQHGEYLVLDHARPANRAATADRSTTEAKSSVALPTARMSLGGQPVSRLLTFSPLPAVCDHGTENPLTCQDQIFGCREVASTLAHRPLAGLWIIAQTCPNGIT